MNSDLISIIVPCYNVEKYLKQCVDSIIKQSYKNIEIILVDDGSIDSTPEICENLAKADSRIKVIHKENGGVSIARNIGIENATGKYITFLDSDDWIECETLKTAYDKMTSCDTDLVVWGYVADFVDENGHKTHSHDFKISGVCENGNAEILTQKHALGLSGYVWNKLYKTEIIKNNNILFEQDISFFEDLVFNSTYFCKCKSISFIDFIGNHYMQRNRETLGTKYYQNILELKLLGCEARENILKHFGINQKIIDATMSSFYYSALKSSIANIKTRPDVSHKEKIKEIKAFLKDNSIQQIAKKSGKTSLKEMFYIVLVRLQAVFILVRI